ncbi:hypothetical protein DNTS_021297, partial [Danionella cerebrum]
LYCLFAGIPVEDKVNIFINSFGSIQETTMDYRVNIFLRQRWNDPRLRLPADFKSDALTVDPKMFQCLWKPDLFFANEKNANFHDVTQENILLFIFRNGDVLISMRLSVTLSCPLDLTLFPMDTQLCKIQLESFGYTTKDLVFMWQSGDPVQMDEIALPQFDVKQEDIEYGNCTKFYPGTGAGDGHSESCQEPKEPNDRVSPLGQLTGRCLKVNSVNEAPFSKSLTGTSHMHKLLFTTTIDLHARSELTLLCFLPKGYYTCVEVIFTLRRQVGFYMMGVYAPTLLIVVLSWLSFWINPDASAARVPLGILSVLSLSSECTSLASELPKVSYVKAIDIWMIACLLYGFASLVEYAVVQVMLNSPKRIEAEKVKMAQKDKAREKENKTPAKANSINGTGGTPTHVTTLQVSVCGLTYTFSVLVRV